VSCVREPETCLKADVCECRWVYHQINDGITDILHGISLAELSDKDLIYSVARKLNIGNQPGTPANELERGTVNKKKGGKKHDTCCKR